MIFHSRPRRKREEENIIMYIQVGRGQNKLNYIEMSDGRKSKGKHGGQEKSEWLPLQV
jgi:hypothetical protein